MAEQGTLVFITGGVRSGKSSFAEKKAMKLSEEKGSHLHYIATGVASDIEMKKRISRHQKEREQSLFSWKTWEQPFHLAELTPFFSKKDILLLDCVTTLLNNEFFQYNEPDIALQKEIKERILDGIMELRSSCQTLIVVSNEVSHEPFQTSLVITYGKLLGELHQQIVKEANQSYLVEAGIPILMKGGSI